MADRKFKDCAHQISKHLKKISKKNPFLLSCVNGDTLTKLNRLNFQSLSDLYDILVKKVDKGVPKFCSMDVALPHYEKRKFSVPVTEDFLEP